MNEAERLLTGNGATGRRGRVVWWAARASEWAVAAAVWFGMQELAHLRLAPAWWVAVLVGWGSCWSLAAWGRAMQPAWRAGWAATEALGPLVIWMLFRDRWAHPLTNGQLLYAAGLLWTAAGGWRAWSEWRVRRGADPVAERWQVVLVGAATLGALLPYFTDRQIGGTDARWYALMLRDYLDQLRAGVFPVFIGQGEYAWNGGVHPFRTAPVYMNLAGILDLLTWRALGVVAVQNLTLTTAGLAGAWGFYAAATALLPQRRWVAAGWAVLYAVAPAWLGVLYLSDAHMTFVAMAVLPAVLYGNARSLLDENGRGYGWLAAGLALVWMTHPPTALLSTLVTVLLQGGSFLFGRAPVKRWRRAAGGALLFAGMAAFYFVGMGELPKAPGVGLQDGLQIAGLLLALAGIGNGFLLGRSRWWLALVLAGAGVAWLGREPWGIWIAVTSGLAAAAGAVMRRRGRVVTGARGLTVLFVALLLGAGLTQFWLGPNHPMRNGLTLAALEVNRAHASNFFLPIKADGFNDGSFQPGTGLWLALGVMGVTSLAGGSVAGGLFFIAGCLPIFALVRVPWIGDFLLGFVPPGVASIVSFTLQIRIFPITSAVLAMGGVVWFATTSAAEAGRWWKRCEGGLLAMAVVWALWQSAPFVRRGWASTSSRVSTVDNLRPENAILDRFAYDLLPVPQHFSHGRTDPWLQARVLDASEKVILGPDETARLMEQNGAQRIRLTARESATSSRWIELSPPLTVAPGEKLLVRFEFDATADYSGWLIWKSARGYREYRLPESGNAEAFGAAAQNSRVISLVNSTDQPAVYNLSQVRDAQNTIKGNGDFFAHAVVSHYRPAQAQVRVDSLIPYRVTATVPVNGWIETSRVMLPGYRATLNGNPVALRASNRGLAMAAAGPGRHELELDYVGTRGVWVALWVSGLTWLGWLVWQMRALVRRNRKGTT